MRSELVCIEPASPPRLAVRQAALPEPGRGEVRIRVRACAINPIDVRRSAGYGRRLLSVKGAGRFPLVLGNDVAGVVDSVGAGVHGFEPDQPVYGVLGTGRGGGAFAGRVVADHRQLLPAPGALAHEALAVLPYTFVTARRAIRDAGLERRDAQRKRVLVNGGAGALGQLAIQLLNAWGCEVTALCGPGREGDCLAAGAQTAVSRRPGGWSALAGGFDVALNFGAWDDEAPLLRCLHPQALGYATTVHPLLANFDTHGWLGGALASRRAWRAGQASARQQGGGIRYAWTVFAPDVQALAELDAATREGVAHLPVAMALPFEEAATGFAHAQRGGASRAVLLPR